MRIRATKWNYERTKLNPKGKEVKAGMKQFLLALKSSVCPNEEEQRNVSNKVKEKNKHFEPAHLTTLQWGDITSSNPNRELNFNAES